MLFFMGAARHFQTLNSGEPQYGIFLIVMLVVVLAIELNAFFGTAATQKPLASVSGTLWGGFISTLVLFGAASVWL